MNGALLETGDPTVVRNMSQTYHPHIASLRMETIFIECCVHHNREHPIKDKCKVHIHCT
jgi:hypothetical protein